MMAGMNRLILIAAIIALGGCDPAHDDAARIDASAIPFDHSPGLLDGYLLRVPKQGNFLWNGALTSDDVLEGYIRQWASLPKKVGRLWTGFGRR
jgi:hypothetical protein